jgi:hypothetical protein
MSGTKNIRGLLVPFDGPHEFTLDEFLDLVRDIVDAKIKHKRLEAKDREREIGFLMYQWHRAPFSTPGEVIPIKQSS